MLRFGFLFRPKWLAFHLLVVVAIFAMISAGFWQLDRLDRRKEFNAAVRDRSEQPTVAFSTVLERLESGELDPDTAEWLPVTLSGTYLPDQLVEFNNSQNGRAGDDVLSALVTDDGTTVIVNRGFVALGTDAPSAPTTRVDVVGFVRPSEVRDRGGLTDAADIAESREVRRIDLPAIAEVYGGDIAPVFVQLIASSPELGPGDPSPVVLPELDEGNHLSYAFQWFIFSICVAIGWVLAVRRSLGSRDAGNDPPDRTDPGSRPDARPEAVTVAGDERTAVGSS